MTSFFYFLVFFSLPYLFALIQYARFFQSYLCIIYCSGYLEGEGEYPNNYHSLDFDPTIQRSHRMAIGICIQAKNSLQIRMNSNESSLNSKRKLSLENVRVRKRQAHRNLFRPCLMDSSVAFVQDD